LANERSNTRLAGVVAAVIAASAIGLLAPVAAGAFSGWTASPSPSPAVWGNILKGTVALSATDVWAVGDQATRTSNQTYAQHWNGSAWSAVPTPNPAGNCQDGNIQWAGNMLKSVAAISKTDVWAVGQGCYANKTLIEHWNGSSWSIAPSPSPSSTGQNMLNGVAALSATNVWAVGGREASNGAMQSLIEHWDGSTWKVVPSPSPSSSGNTLSAISAVSPTDIWAVGWVQSATSQTLVEHWDGSSWKVVASPSPGTRQNQLTAVKAVSANNVWSVGSRWNGSGATLTLVEHWNGSSWSTVPSPNIDTAYGSANTLSGVAAVSASEVWAVGMFQNANTSYHQHRTLSMRWNGTSWGVVSSPTPGKSGELNAITALPTGGLFAVGLFSPYDINIYDQTYTAPKTLVLKG
jgi:hypothetical protein